MTKRFKKKVLKAAMLAVKVGWDFGILTLKSMQLAVVQLCDAVNAYAKNFSMISMLVAISIASLMISLVFGPFKMCEFLAACWLSESLWMWFRGE